MTTTPTESCAPAAAPPSIDIENKHKNIHTGVSDFPRALLGAPQGALNSWGKFTNGDDDDDDGCTIDFLHYYTIIVGCWIVRSKRLAATTTPRARSQTTLTVRDKITVVRSGGSFRSYNSSTIIATPLYAFTISMREIDFGGHQFD